MPYDISRRRFLAGVGAASSLALHNKWGRVPPAGLGQPGDRPAPLLPEGTDLLPQIEHIIVYMQENHSYDSILGMHPRGDGFDMRGGIPRNSEIDLEGDKVSVFHAPDTCQSGEGVSQNWVATHLQIDSGRMDGFLFNDNTNALRYWDGTDLPFYYSLANTFPVCDRWFASAPCQTYPNRLYLQAATSQTLIATDVNELLALPHPAGGTIWDKLNAFGVDWLDYCIDLPDIFMFPSTFSRDSGRVRHFNDFLTDCQAGTLPSVSIISPGINNYTEENPHDIQLGEAYSSSIINAVMASPCWPTTVLAFMYDEHGGYYDHVAPPAAIPPDDILPDVAPAPGAPDAWTEYGLRVPAYVISPFSKPNHVSHVVRDHTSVLRFIETKFNLGALTRRDANAHDLLECLDLVNPPAFLEPPVLASPGLPATGSLCTPDIPPPPTQPSAEADVSVASIDPGPPRTASQADRVELFEHYQRAVQS